MPGRMSPIEEVNLVAKVADLKLELERQLRTLDALIALLEDKGLINVDELQEKTWQMNRRSVALRQAAKAHSPLSPSQSAAAFLHGRPDASGKPGTFGGAGGSAPPGCTGRSGTMGKLGANRPRSSVHPGNLGSGTPARPGLSVKPASAGHTPGPKTLGNPRIPGLSGIPARPGEPHGRPGRF